MVHIWAHFFMVVLTNPYLLRSHDLFPVEFYSNLFILCKLSYPKWFRENFLLGVLDSLAREWDKIPAFTIIWKLRKWNDLLKPKSLCSHYTHVFLMDFCFSLIFNTQANRLMIRGVRPLQTTSYRCRLGTGLVAYWGRVMRLSNKYENLLS